MTTTDYDQQAADFLNKWGIDFSAKAVSANPCPPFCDGKHIHGDCYQITFKRALTGRRISFRFWNSLNDSQKGEQPTAYDVLTCSSSDIGCPETFEDFCGEYGYDQDSRKALATFKACAKHGERLRYLFDDDTMQMELQQIS